MAELADALVLGSSVYDVQVQVLLSALNNKNPNLFSTGRGSDFGFLQQSKMKIQMSAASRFFSRDAALFNSFGQWQLPAQPPLSSWQEWEPQACSASWDDDCSGRWGQKQADQPDNLRQRHPHCRKYRQTAGCQPAQGQPGTGTNPDRINHID